MKKKLSALTATALVISLLLSSCGNDGNIDTLDLSDDTTPSQTETTPVEATPTEENPLSDVKPLDDFPDDFEVFDMDFAQDEREYTNLLEYSDTVATDGITDISDILQSCVDENDGVFLPAGEYYISKTIKLHDNSGIKGEDGTVLNVQVGFPAFEAFGVEKTENESGKLIENIYVADLDVAFGDISGLNGATPSLSYRVVNAKSVNGLYVENIDVTDAGVVCVDSFGTYVDDRYDEMSRNIYIRNCTGDGKDGTSDHAGAGFVDIRYSENFIVRDCHFENYGGGVTVLGGSGQWDERTINGNVRGARNGLFENLSCKCLRWGSICGFATENFTVRNCYCEDVMDVGIDFEGCNRCQAIDNELYNCTLGSIWHHTGIILFSNNKVTLDKHTRSLPMPYSHTNYFSNANVELCTLAGAESHVIIENCYFEMVGMVGSIGLFYTSPAMARFTVRNNTFINTVCGAVHYNQGKARNEGDDRTDICDIHNITITDNEFSFTESITRRHPGVIFAITNQTRGGDEPNIVVTGNTVTTSELNEAKYAIVIEKGINTLDDTAICSDNVTEGFVNGISIVTHDGGNFDVTLENNTVESIVTSGDGELTTNRSNNVNANGDEVELELAQ